MKIRRVGWAGALTVSALFAASAWAADSSVAPQQLDCVLTDTGARPGSESRPITIVFDEDAKTLTAKDGDRSFSFSKVSISNVSINGLDDDALFAEGIGKDVVSRVWRKVRSDWEAWKPGRHGIAAIERVFHWIRWTKLCQYGADFLVAGAYGHAPLREWVFGGFTHNVLRRSRQCSFLAH